MANRYIRQDLEQRMFALNIKDGEAKCRFINEAVREKLDRIQEEDFYNDFHQTGGGGEGQ